MKMMVLPFEKLKKILSIFDGRRCLTRTKNGSWKMHVDGGMIGELMSIGSVGMKRELVPQRKG